MSDWLMWIILTLAVVAAGAGFAKSLAPLFSYALG
jgi:hypothetical protein